MASAPPNNAPVGIINTTGGKHIFNNDLLVNAGDLAYIKNEFPEIIHVLDHPELREVFLRYDGKANAARVTVRRMGLAAILTALFTLLGAATEPIWGHFTAARGISIVLESCALVATLIMVGRLRHSTTKTAWLESRLMTERLRQWHFQLLVCRMPEIEASCDPNNPHAVEHFKAERARWFSSFLYKHEGTDGGRLDSMLEGIDKGLEEAQMWLHPAHGASLSDQSAVLPIIHKAYQELRFDHQLGYTNSALKKNVDLPLHQFLKWPILLQEAMLNSFAWSCLQGAFVCSALIVLCSAFLPGPNPTGSSDGSHVQRPAASMFEYGTLLPILVLSFTIVGVALRTIQEGLGVTKDIERYRAYRTKVSSLRAWFARTGDAATRHELMKEMEVAVNEELKEFLRTHTETKFVL